MDIVPKFLDEALTPVAKELGQRLADLVSLAFTPIIKLKGKRDHNLEIFLSNLNDKVKNIPEEDLIEPPAHIVGPLLEDMAKFYHDEEYLRDLFSNLIASTMDRNKSDFIHPSFKFIIDQLSADDAKFLKYIFYPRKPFIENPDLNQLSFLCAVATNSYTMEENAHYFIPESSREYVVFDRHIFFSLERGYDYLRGLCSNTIRVGDEEFDIKRSVNILNTLNRLGLLTFSEGTVEIDEIEKIKSLEANYSGDDKNQSLLFAYCHDEPDRVRVITVVLSILGISFAKSCIEA